MQRLLKHFVPVSLHILAQLLSVNLSEVLVNKPVFPDKLHKSIGQLRVFGCVKEKTCVCPIWVITGNSRIEASCQVDLFTGH